MTVLERCTHESNISRAFAVHGVRYPAPPGADALIGARVPDVALRDGRRLYEAPRGGRFVMLGSAEARDLPPQVDAAAPARPSRRADRLVRVRPDGYVGWAGQQADVRSWADAYFRPQAQSVEPVSSRFTDNPVGRFRHSQITVCKTA